MNKQRIYKSILILLGLVLISLPEIAVAVQAIKNSYELPTIFLCLLLSATGIVPLLFRNKMFPVEEAGF